MFWFVYRQVFVLRALLLTSASFFWSHQYSIIAQKSYFRISLIYCCFFFLNGRRSLSSFDASRAQWKPKISFSCICSYFVRSVFCFILFVVFFLQIFELNNLTLRCSTHLNIQQTRVDRKICVEIWHSFQTNEKHTLAHKFCSNTRADTIFGILLVFAIGF